jgi:hypothetical protein
VRGLDKSGFDYVRNVPTGFKEWESDEEIVSSYYPETVRWVQTVPAGVRVSRCTSISRCTSTYSYTCWARPRSLIKDALGASRVFM